MKWEYMFITLPYTEYQGIQIKDEESLKKLNELGKEGWELVGMMGIKHILKRELK